MGVITEKVEFVQRPEGDMRAVQENIFKKRKRISKKVIIIINALRPDHT